MFVEVVQRTPWWVWPLFVALLVLGLRQRRDRIVDRPRLLVLPLAMVAVSLHGVVSSFGVAAAALAGWAVGLGALLYKPLMERWRGVRAVRVICSAEPVAVAGSWLPLVLMMTIFVVRYVVGVVFARGLAPGGAWWFMALVGFVLGACSGRFVARAWVVLARATPR